MPKILVIIIVWLGLVETNDRLFNITDPHNLMTYGFVSGIIAILLGWLIETALRG